VKERNLWKRGVNLSLGEIALSKKAFDCPICGKPMQRGVVFGHTWAPILSPVPVPSDLYWIDEEMCRRATPFDWERLDSAALGFRCKDCEIVVFHYKKEKKKKEKKSIR